MKKHQYQRKTRTKKSKRLHVTFPFRPINTSKLHMNGFQHSTRQYKRFTKRCFRVLKTSGYKRGCLDLRGDLVLTMNVGISDHRVYLDKET